MSGHSKWSKVKHQKEDTDAVKGKIFTKMASAIIIAVKEGGGSDPDSNFKLRLAIEKAKSVNTPKENIQRAIEKAKGSVGGDINEILYEAIGPSGIGILIKSATDNKQRTVSEIKNSLEKNGGILAGSGAVSYLFEEVGMIETVKPKLGNDELFEKILDAGAEDFEEEGENIFIYSSHKELHNVRVKLENEGFTILAAELFFKPKLIISIDNEEKQKKIKNLLNILEEREDVQKVFTNYTPQS